MRALLLNLFIVFLVIKLSPAIASDCLNENDEMISDSIYIKADVMPEPVGGMNALTQKIVYPPEAKSAGIEGKVLVSFVVDEKGRVNSPSILKSDNDLLSGAALKAVSQLEFSPGKIAGKKVKVKMILPIVFKLDEKDKAAVEDTFPFPVGGMESLMKKIVYPETAVKNKIEGKVMIKAVIDADGNVQEVTILKSVGSGCDEAAVTAVKATKFTPGKKNGQPVQCEITIPVMFKLQ
jgi:TonB family protein